jgi:Trm5-related predicted tRNA methylase
MTRIDPDRVAHALLNAPGWARVGLTAPTEIIREAAAQELALTIARIDGEATTADPNQLVLAL